MLIPFPHRGQGVLSKAFPGDPFPPKRRRDPHTLGFPYPPVWFHLIDTFTLKSRPRNFGRHAA